MTSPSLPPIPVLRLDGLPPDAETLETWRESLSSVLGAEVPHSLLGLWVAGVEGVALIGPEGLGPEALPVPAPEPAWDAGALERIEDVVRRAGYASTTAVPLRHGGRDVGLLLVADFPARLYDDHRRRVLAEAAEAMAPVMAAIGGHAEPLPPAAEPEPEPAPQASFAEAAELLDPARSPAAMIAGLSALLQARLPHARLALVVAEPTLDDRYRLDAHEDGMPWSDLRLVVAAAAFDPRAPAWPPPLDEAEQGLVPVACVEVRGQERVLGWLLAGGPAPAADPAVAELVLAEAARLVAPRVEAHLLAFQATVLRSHLGVLRNVPASLARLAELLATTAQFGTALRLFAREASAVLPFSRLEVALRAGSADEVVRLEPGQSRAIAELPVTSVEGTELGRVVGGELPYALATDRRGEEVSGALIVPLRVAGRITGALLLHAQGPDTFSRPDAALAQQLADVLAPHLELARRPGGPAPILPVPPSIRRPARSF